MLVLQYAEPEAAALPEKHYTWIATHAPDAPCRSTFLEPPELAAVLRVDNSTAVDDDGGGIAWPCSTTIMNPRVEANPTSALWVREDEELWVARRFCFVFAVAPTGVAGNNKQVGARCSPRGRVWQEARRRET